MKFIVFILLLVLFISGCTSAIKSVASNYEYKLSLGLTKDEVQKRLGSPSRISSQTEITKDTNEKFNIDFWIYNFTTFWQNPIVTEQLYITFVNDKVISWGPNPNMTQGLTTIPDTKQEIIIKER